MSNNQKRSNTPSVHGTPQNQLNQSSNRNNISNSSNKIFVSAYFDRKHQNTKEKIEHMRTEAYNKLMSEVKPKPTISLNSKKILHELFKKQHKGSHNQPGTPVSVSKSLHRHNTETNNSSKQKINISNYTTNTNISQIEQYKMIVQSRDRKMKELRNAKQRKSYSLISKSEKEKKCPIVITEIVKCQRDRLFYQEYVPYNEKAVFDIRAKLQKYYDCKTECKAIPFNQHATENKDKDKVKDNISGIKGKDAPVVVIRNNDINEMNKGKEAIFPMKKSTLMTNVCDARRERDVKLLLEFTKGLGQCNSNNERPVVIKDDKREYKPTNSNNDKNSHSERESDKMISNGGKILKQVIIQNNVYNKNNQGHQLIKINKEANRDYKQLNPSAKLFVEERMKMIKNNFQIQEPPNN